MAARHMDLTGDVYGRLTVIRLTKKEGYTVFWMCRCECGSDAEVRAGSLRSGLTRSCGCLAKDVAADGFRTHGMSKYSGFGSWRAMMSRCNNAEDSSYKDYGARGISVCSEWHDIRNFAKDMGDKVAGQSIDRLDPNKGYFPENCRWTDPLGQGENKRNSVKAKAGGELKHMASIWREAGMRESTFYNRINRGMTPDEAVSAPVQRKNVKAAIDGVERTLVEWSEVTGIKCATLRYRYRKGLRGAELIAPTRK